MRVAYVHDEDLIASSGVARKVRAQFREWERHGIVPTSIGLRDLARHGRPLRGLEKLRAHWANVSALGDRLRDASPDLVYMRYVKWAPGLVDSLGAHPVLLEVNTNDRNEYFAAGLHHGIYNSLTRGYLLRRVEGFVGVTPELIDAAVIGRREAPREVISNGYDFARVVLSRDERRATRSLRPSCVFVGTEGHLWHGLDRLLELARHLPDWTFRVVGVTQPRAEGSADALPNVSFLGALSGDALGKVLRASDIGIGSLALSRIGLRQACPLKSREYFAYGLPVIFCYEDPDIAEGDLMSLELDDTPWNPLDAAERCREFVRRVASTPKGEVRDWAEARMSTSLKESLRAKFMYRAARGFN